MIEDHDRDLRERFVALRRHVATDAPPFQATVATARARGSARWGRRGLWLAAAALAASVALALLLVRRGRPDGHVGIDLTAVRWRAPTDFLLTLPGSELLRSVPRLGRLTIERRTL
jgi:hypothetical protein